MKNISSQRVYKIVIGALRLLAKESDGNATENKRRDDKEQGHATESATKKKKVVKRMTP